MYRRNLQTHYNIHSRLSVIAENKMVIINVCWTAQRSSALPYKLLAHCEMLFHNIFTFLLLCSPFFKVFLCSFYFIFLFSLICFLLFASRLYVFHLHKYVCRFLVFSTCLFALCFLPLSILIELCSMSLWLYLISTCKATTLLNI